MKKHLLTLVLFILSVSTFSQDILVMATGDTLRNLKITSVDDQFIYVQQNINGAMWNSLIKKEKVSSYAISNQSSSINNVVKQPQANNNNSNNVNNNPNREIVSFDFGVGFSKILDDKEIFNESTLINKYDETRLMPTFNFSLIFFLTEKFGIGGKLSFSKKTSSEFNDVLLEKDPYSDSRVLWSGEFNRSINNFSLLMTNKFKLDNKNKQNIHLTMYFGKYFYSQGGDYKYTIINTYTNTTTYENETFKATNNKKWGLGGSISYEHKIFENVFIGAEANYQHYKVDELKIEDEYLNIEELKLSRAGINAFIRFK